MDFGELDNDASLKEKVTKLHESVDKIQNILQTLQKADVYNTLEPIDKVNYDLFLSYTLNTLYWLYLRTKGIDPNKNDIKNELNRVKSYMLKAKEAKDRTLRPRVNQDASKRFIKNATWENDIKPPTKKRKFDN